jgi:hypothetical protein
MTTREGIHQLLDSLPDELLPAAEARLAALRDDAFLRFMLAAPEDDELLDDEDLAALAEGRAAFERGETISLEEFERKYGVAD